MTPERQELLELLTELSSLRPDVRLGQWLMMFAYSARGTHPEAVYDAEDEELLPVVRRFVSERKAELAEPLIAVA